MSEESRRGAGEAGAAPAGGPGGVAQAAARLADLWERLPPDIREPLAGLWERLPSYLRLAWGLGRDGRLSHRQKLGVYAGGLYNVSPIDAVPGFIPVVGQLDDCAALLLGIRKTLRACPPEIRDEHLTRCGVTEEMLNRDLAEIRRVAGFLTRTALRGAWTGIRESSRAWYRMGQNAARRGRGGDGEKG